MRRYDAEKLTVLRNRSGRQPHADDPNDATRLIIDWDAITVGELRGFSGDGEEVTYLDYPQESSNIDVFAADLMTGAGRRLTSHPKYVDPLISLQIANGPW